MNHLSLEAEVRQHVEGELGVTVPDPNSTEFEAFLDELKESHPELAQALVQGLKVEGAELPIEQEARKAERREQRRRLMHRLFYSQDVEGEPTLNKRKALFVIASCLVAILPLMLLQQNAARNARASARALASEAVAETLPVVSLTPPPEERGWPDEELDPPLFDTRLGDEARSPFPTQSGALPPPPGAVDPNVAGSPPMPGAQAIPLSLYRPETSAPGLQGKQPLSAFTELQYPPAPLSVHEALPASTQLRLESSNIGVQRETSGALSIMSQVDSAAGAEARLSVLGEASTDEDTSSSLSAYRSEPQGLTTVAAASGSLHSSREAGQGIEAPERTTQASSTPTSQDAEVSQPAAQVPDAPAASPSESLSGTTEQDALLEIQQDAVLLDALRPGARLDAHLATGVAVTEAVVSPVVAETPEGGDWCAPASSGDCPAVIWLGTARLEGPNRITVRFDEAVVGSHVRAVMAVALGPDNLPGLTASVHDLAPTAAQDLLRAAAGGASDYVSALVNRQRVTIVGGRVVVEDLQAPSLAQFILGRTTQLFSLPSQQTAVVRVAQVAPGTPLQVLYGVGIKN